MPHCKKTKTLTTILIILFSVGLINCTPKPVFTCGLANHALTPKFDSKVLRLERVGAADTTIAFISGSIYGKDSSDTHVSTDTLIAAYVCLVDQATGKIYCKPTDLNGKYQFSLPVSTYNLKVQYIAYNTLVIRNVKLETGDIVEFDALLGLSGACQDSSVYVMQDDNTIKLINQTIKTKR